MDANLKSDFKRENDLNSYSFFEIMDDLVFVIDPNGKILYGNKAVFRKLGYSREEFVAKHVLDMHLEQDREEARAIFSAMLKGDRDTCPLPLRKKSGECLPVETRVWKGTWNGVDCILGLCKDLSAEQEALQLFKRIFSHNPMPMALSRVDTEQFFDVNDAFLALLGYSREEVIGRTGFELNLFLSPERQREASNRLLETKGMSGLELQVRTKNGNILDGVFSGEIIQSQGQEFFLTAMIDVTLLREAESALLKSREQLKMAVESSRTGLWDWEVKTGNVIFNESWARIIGYTLEELEPISIRTWQENCHLEDLKKSDELLKRHFFGELPYYEHEARMRHKNGHWVWVLDRGKVVEWDEDGKPVRMLGVHVNISEQKNVEERINQLNAQLEVRVKESTEELVHVSRIAVLGQITAAVAHELNQPLGSILNWASTAQVILSEASPDLKELQVILSKIKREDERAANVIKRIQGLVKREQTENELLDVDLLICEVVGIAKNGANLRGVELRQACSADKKMIFGDKVQLQQVLLNLISNAVQAYNAEGSNQITISSEIDQNGIVTVSVSDSGFGFKEENVESMFKPFYTTKKAGLGIGLFICRLIIQAHGGKLSARNNPDKGATFFFSLPSARSGGGGDDD